WIAGEAIPGYAGRVPHYVSAQVSIRVRAWRSPAGRGRRRGADDARGYTGGDAVYPILQIRDWSSIQVKVKDLRSTLRLVRRRCLVCDAEQEVLERAVTDEIGPSCPACGAPTERTAVLRDRLIAKNPHAVALGRLGGVKGGPARAEALTPQRRREIAR